MLIVRYKATKTPSSATVSWNTDDLRGVMRQLLVQTATSTNTFDFKLVDDDGITVYERKGNKGTLNVSTPMGLYGIYTATISNATDEEFKISIRYEEYTGASL